MFLLRTSVDHRALFAGLLGAVYLACGGSPASDGGSPATPPVVPAPVSIEFGRTLWGTDDCLHPAIPSGGSLFSVWGLIPDPGTTYPWSRGNMDVYVAYGDNWHLRCLIGNSRVDTAGGTAFYNANSMLFAGPEGTWVDDYSFYATSDVITEAQARGWVWGAWQVIVEQDAFTLRQWLKFGLDGEVIAAGESHPTFQEIRSMLVSQRGWTQAQADAWTPGDATRFQVGKDHGYLCHARMTAKAALPSLLELDGLAKADAADPTAWADYELDWKNGSPNLTDRSGHGRHLAIEAGGTLHQGPPGPTF